MIEIRLDCKPVPWSAPTKGLHTFYDKKSKVKESTCWQIFSQYNGPIIDEFVSLEFTFYVPIPKNTSKVKRKEMLDHKILPTSPDTTNMQKLYEDCLQGIVIQNDRLSHKITSIRYYSDRPGVEIKIRPWHEEINQQKGAI